MSESLSVDREALGDAILDALCNSPVWEGRHIGELEVHIADGIADALLSSGIFGQDQ